MIEIINKTTISIISQDRNANYIAHTKVTSNQTDGASQ